MFRLSALEPSAFDLVLPNVVLEAPFAFEGATDPEQLERSALVLQHRVDLMEREARRAEVHRLEAMANAYTASMADVAVRFSSRHGRRTGLGAQAFFKQTGLAIGMSPRTVAHLVDTTLLLQERLPSTWNALTGLAITRRAAELVVARADGLAAEHWARYDAEAAELAASTPITSLKRRLRDLRERIQAETAPERARRTVERRHVVLEEGDDGEGSLVITGPIAELAAVDDALTKAAIAEHGADGETRTISQLRFDVARDLLLEGIKQAAVGAWDGLAVPGRKGVVPKVVVTIPLLSALGHSTEHARLQGHGPMDVETAKRLAGTATSFVRVLTDPCTGVRLDMDRGSRVPPEDLKRWVRLRDEICRFPGCDRPAHLCDIDHVHEWQHGGVTSDGNLVCVCRRDHLAKSEELFRNELLRTGAARWHLPWGRCFDDPPPAPMEPAPAPLHRHPGDEPCPF